MLHRHAYLIMVHHEFELLTVLLSLLDDSRNDIYIHVDKRVKQLNTNTFKCQFANLYFVDERIKVYWGHVSQIKLEFLLFQKANDHGPYAYYHLLSGVDLPIKSQDYIHNFFQTNTGKEFVGFSTGQQNEALKRIQRYWFFMELEKKYSTTIQIISSKIRQILAKYLPLRKTENLGDIRKGPNWVSITHSFCNYLLEHKKSILKRYKYTFCGDEVFLQTLIWNSDFREQIYDIENEFKGSLRLVDWKRGSKASPYIWRMADKKMILDSDALFARKFSYTLDAQIVLFISQYVKIHKEES